MTALVALHANFRMAGWRWPFRLGDVLEVWRGQDLVGEISVELLASLVTHYLVGHDLVRRFDAAILPAAAHGGSGAVLSGRRPESEPPWRPLVTRPEPARAVRDRDSRAALRARRRARSPGS
jgi:hypothetical protein